MRPLRVLTIGHSYVVRLNRSVAAQLSRLPGVELTVAAPAFFHADHGPMALEPKEDEPFELHALPARLTRWIHVFSYAPGPLEALVRPGRFDVVHAWEEPYILAGWQLGRAAQRAGVPFCFRTAQSLVKRYPPPFRTFERATLRAAQGWIAGGRLVHRAMVEKGFPEERGEVITLGVGLDAFRPLTAEEIERGRARLGVPGPVIGYLGRLVPQKGLKVLMRALESVPGPWSLVLLGSGPMQGEVESWAQARGAGERVRVLQVRHDEVPGLLGAFDLLVAPSQTTRRWKEQFGRMLIEAFACGVPVVASDSGEIPFVVGDAGRVVGERDVAGWTAAISELLADPALRGRLAEAGRRRCRERFGADAVARRLLSFLQRVAGRAEEAEAEALPVERERSPAATSPR